MIEINLQAIRPNMANSINPNSTSSIMSKLGSAIDKEKFYGTIIVKCEAGKVVYCTLEQRFTTEGLLKLINP